jgi:hypothetical protein
VISGRGIHDTRRAGKIVLFQTSMTQERIWDDMHDLPTFLHGEDFVKVACACQQVDCKPLFDGEILLRSKDLKR